MEKSLGAKKHGGKNLFFPTTKKMVEAKRKAKQKTAPPHALAALPPLMVGKARYSRHWWGTWWGKEKRVYSDLL